MKGGVLFAGAVALAMVACSSSGSSSPACKVAGTYTGFLDSQSGTCPSSGSGTVTDTITARPAGASGPDFILEITGLQGACELNYVDEAACKVQGKCDATITDALTPGDKGTIQYSWTFDAAGFHGTSTVDLPPAKSLPNGCSGQATVHGTRQ